MSAGPGSTAGAPGWGAVAAVAAVISYRHAYELVSSHGESGLAARLLPFTVDGLILAASSRNAARWDGRRA